ncbi:MAG: YopX family protein [Bacillota bacterium]
MKLQGVDNGKLITEFYPKSNYKIENDWDQQVKLFSFTTRTEIETEYGDKMMMPDWGAVDGGLIRLPSGQNDRNGKVIYEGDILKVNKLTFKSSWPLPENLLVKFYGGMFQLYRGDENLMGLHLMYIEDGEVIGNIYDNPDLLEGGYE